MNVETSFVIVNVVIKNRLPFLSAASAIDFPRDLCKVFQRTRLSELENVSRSRDFRSDLMCDSRLQMLIKFNEKKS